MAVVSGHTSESYRLPPAGCGPSRAHEDDPSLRRLLLALREDHPIEPWPGHRAHRSKFPEVLATLARLAAGGEPVEARLETACCLIAESLSVDAAAVLEPAASVGRLAVRAGAGSLAGALGEEPSCGPGTQAGLAMGQAGVCASADLGAAWPTDDFAARHGLTASALVALPGPAGPLGLLGVYEAARRAFEPDELGFLQAAGALLATALWRREAEAERQRLLARLEAAERLVSLGKLAGGVAHQLNNPLAYVTANLAFISEEATALAGRLEAVAAIDTELAESARQLVDAAADTRDGVETMRGVVRDLQRLSGGDDGTLKSIDLTPVLEASLNLAGSDLRHRARVERALESVLPPVRANEVRLGQVFLGLLVRAAQAIPEGHVEEHLVRVSTGVVAGDRVAVEVSDTGPAPPAGRPTEAGAESGLAACRSLVEGLGGELQVEWREEGGTTCRVLLPMVAIQPGEAHPGEPSPRRRRLLVVDDEPMVGAVLERTLGEEYDLVLVDGARAALELLQRGETFDLIFSDLLMPDLSGMELFHEVERFDPALAARMIFLSGGAFTLATREFLARPGVECIEKPFDLATIRGAIARRLGSS